MVEAAMEVSQASGNRFPYTLFVRERHATLDVRRGVSPYQATDRFEAFEPTTQRKLAAICLAPEWAGLGPWDTKSVTFLELARRDGQSMDRTQEAFQDGRPRTSGYKLHFPDVVIVLAVEKDRDGLWQRVQLCEIEYTEWMSLSPLEDGLFLMK